MQIRRSQNAKNTICIIGADVRAAAFSAIRAGATPICADLFADRDLQALAFCDRISEDGYPDELGKLLEANPGIPWMYTGGLENHPELLINWQKFGKLLGNAPATFRRLRDPMELSEVCKRFGVRYPGVYSKTLEVDSLDGQFLTKPIQSTGGLGIQDWNGDELADGCYLQKKVCGISIAAIYLCDSSESQFCGITRQLVGEPWLHAPGYQYCGSIGPLPTSESQELQTIGTILSTTGLKGIIGVDLLQNSDGLHLIEINPRFTASVEVLELALGRSILGQHFVAFGFDTEPVPFAHNSRQVIGKAIYYAPMNFELPATGPWDDVLNGKFDAWTAPKFADISESGARFRRGDPVTTMLTSGSDVRECESRLKNQAKILDDLFGVSTHSRNELT